MLQHVDIVGTGTPHREEGMATAALQTEIGWIEVSADSDAITHLHWRGVQPQRLQSSTLVKEAVKQLQAYFDKRLMQFDVPIAADGTGFARDVWDVMLSIPYGQTLTYGEVATRLNAPAQAVGQACGQNPIAIIIPCHRIVGTNWLGGYSSELGINAKEYLLDLERGQGRLF
ncbi:methylated-DNA--[protein]-cysteine S-methyltransferase [Dongia deserti]|uniref:methylated-DNA--[protein]-cysteine S-methyltransferase n=1 Tax=Dongia deserti TaxID=2268030 RepID=UPI000E6489A8|nr:methylated-DNA--[protein]-cysteine S-methyltransferase [Dongia deserti]